MGRHQPRGGNSRGRTRGSAKSRGDWRTANRGRQGSGAVLDKGKVNGKLDRWRTAEDIPVDEEDEFFAGRDKVLLDNAARTRASVGDEDEFDQDDEVFGLDGVGDLDSEERDTDSEEELPVHINDKGTTEPRHTDDSGASSDSEEELSHWGRARAAYYADNSRVMDADDQEAREMEEQEGRRLQARLLAEIREDDWGFNDVHDTEDDVHTLSAVPASPPPPVDKASLLRHMERHDPLALALARDWQDIAHQVLETTTAVKEAQTSDPDDPALGLMHLHHQTLLSYAATLAFYLHLQSAPSDVDALDTDSCPPPLLPAEAKRLRTEVTGRLLTLKQSLSTLEDLGFAVDGDDDEFSDEDDVSVDGGSSFVPDSDEGIEGSDGDVSPYGVKPGEHVSHASGGQPRLQNLEDWQQDKVSGWMNSSEPPQVTDRKKKKQKPSGLALEALDEGELEALMQDALELDEPAMPPISNGRTMGVDVAEPTVKEGKKKKKKKVTPAESVVFDLVEPEFMPTKAKEKRGQQNLVAEVDVDSEAFGDPTQLSHTDASDKAGRRRTLRFHTSKIESTSNRRSAARAGMGGDDDLPYRERRKEQRRTGLGQGGDDLDTNMVIDADNVDPDIRSTGKRARDSYSPVHDEQVEGEDGYYELVRQAKKQRKEEKKAEYESMRAAERIDPDCESTSGPRSLTKTILKNRGMVANRSPKNKTARNPRVKKKVQYAKAQKKLGSRQAVFKGGAEVAAAREGRYVGERSGISERVVKSVKL